MTIRQDRFVKFYLKSGNATQAAIEAGYSKNTAYSIGSENLKKPEIKKKIEEAGEKLAKKLDYSVAESFQNLVKAQELALARHKKDLRTYVKAEELKGRLFGLYEKSDVTVNFNTSPFEIKVMK